MGFMSSASGASVSQVVLGAIQVYIVEDTGWDIGTLSIAVTTGTWCSGFLSAIAGPLADRYGPRLLVPMGLIVVGCALLALSAVNTDTIWQFFIAYVIGRSVSNPFLIGVVPRVATVNFFRRRRGVTLAISGMARPIGGAINIQIISLIAVTQSWRASYGYVGLFMLALSVPVFFIMRRTPEEMGLLPDGDRPAPGQVQASRSSGGRRAGRRGPTGTAEFSWTAREAMKTRAYWCIAGTAVLAIIASAGVGYILAPYLVSESGPGLSNQQAAGVVSLAAYAALIEIWRGARARRVTFGENWIRAVSALFRRNQRRYGGYVVHLGVTVIGIGVIASSVFQTESQHSLSRGDSVVIRDYALRYDDFVRAQAVDGRLMRIAMVSVYRDGARLAQLRPRIDDYPDMPMTIAGAHSTIENDFYVLLIAGDEDRATFRVYINPLVNLVWWGGILLVIGTVIAAWQKTATLPAARKRERRQAA